MNYFVLNKNLEVLAPIDEYESLIWTERNDEAGDFELYAKPNTGLFDILRKGYFIISSGSEFIMMIESINTTSDDEDGHHVIFSGESTESILKRRIIWNQTTLAGNLQDCIERVLNENVIFPNDATNPRKIPNFKFVKSSAEEITSLTIDEIQLHGESVYEFVVSCCQSSNIGFRIFMDDDGCFTFKLSKGTDRSYAQDTNPVVEFSPRFDNLINSDYTDSDTEYKNVLLVVGGDRDVLRASAVGEASGLDRREIFIDATDISTTDDYGNIISDAEFINLLTARGNEELNNYKQQTDFITNVSPVGEYVYKTHYYLGDIVEVVDIYGHEARCVLSAFTYSESESGTENYPTFTVVK